MFNVTWERWRRLSIKTIAALDTPAVEVEAAKARRRESKRKYNEARRRRIGVPTRAQYLASVKSTASWKTEGISRTTAWRRRKATEAVKQGTETLSYLYSTGVASPCFNLPNGLNSLLAGRPDQAEPVGMEATLPGWGNGLAAKHGGASLTVVVSASGDSKSSHSATGNLPSSPTTGR
jgi:hypothetical protein